MNVTFFAVDLAAVYLNTVRGAFRTAGLTPKIYRRLMAEVEFQICRNNVYKRFYSSWPRKNETVSVLLVKNSILKVLFLFRSVFGLFSSLVEVIPFVVKC